MPTFSVPTPSLIVLVGPSGSGKSTFARQHFLATEVISSDDCRGFVADDPNDQSATSDAFDVLHYLASKRLERGRLTVIDATNVQPEARKPLVELAREWDVLPVAIVLDLPERICHERNSQRADRAFGPHVVRGQIQQLRRSQRFLKREGFRHVFWLSSIAEVEAAVIERVPLWTDRRHETGPFDIIGDVHGCCDELERLLGQLGYEAVRASEDGPWSGPIYAHPAGRRAVFVGDLVDRGPRVLDTLRLVRNMVAHGSGLCVAGNHDAKLLRKLRGKDVRITHGLEQTLAELDAMPFDEAARAAFRDQLAEFLDGLLSHYVLNGGRLVVAHAGMKERYQGRASGRVREFALYGETTGETDEFGLPVRHNWAAEYRGSAMVVYGHTPVPEPEWLNGTINVDTGAVFGGKLTALRYPERELVSVPAARLYCEPARPFLPPGAEAAAGTTAQQIHDDVLDIDDVLGKRIVSTRLMSHIAVREENSIAALEVMSRFAVDPRWLIYLPPTMSPCETSRAAGLLEHPSQAFEYFRSNGVPRVVCQEKHMGSRAVVVVCRDEAVAAKRFGIANDGGGIVYTRTGRRFFEDRRWETALLDELRAGLSRAGFWDDFASDWFCLDCELMPWSAKAQELLRRQYAPVGRASITDVSDALTIMRQAASRPDLANADEMNSLLALTASRRDAVERYSAAYRQYCWSVESPDDLKLAPFHLLASEEKVHTDKDHVWHMRTLAKLAQNVAATDGMMSEAKLFEAAPTDTTLPPSPRRGGPGRGDELESDLNPSSPPSLTLPAEGRESEPAMSEGVVISTRHLVVDVTDPESEAAGVRWWEELTASGGEGMVVKPLDWVVRGAKGLVQPAVKCRGPEYLRIIYGPEYDRPEHLARLRSRGLNGKRSLALREFALGLESLERFVRREPLRRVHECAFGVLALESEPVDPRL